MGIHVRTASIADIDELGRLFDGYRVFYERASDPDLARLFLTNRLEKNESTIFIACTSDGSGCGFTQLFRSFSSVSAKQIWVLNDLYVDQSSRRKGVGRLLMNRARQFAVDTESKGILLETGIDNVNAQALYESLGYAKNTDSFYYFLDVE